MILGCDHDPVFLRVHRSFRAPGSRRVAQFTRCGNWQLDLPSVAPTIQALPQPLSSQDGLEELAKRTSRRPVSFRYKDSDDIRELIRVRKLETDPAERRKLGREIHTCRQAAKAEWQHQVLQKASAGHYHAISYLRRRKSTMHEQSKFIANSGGEERAAKALQHFYKLK